MSEENLNDDAAVEVTELDMLKERARVMGIVFSNNIGLDALKKKIADKMSGEAEPETKAAEVNPLGVDLSDKPKTPLQIRQEVMASAMALVRVRITNMDPKKKDLAGEVFTVANEYIGNVKHYVPYGEETEDGWHLPRCIVDQLEARQYLQIRTVKDRRTGTTRTTQAWVKEFALQVLPQLTQAELDKIAAAQAAAAGA